MKKPLSDSLLEENKIRTATWELKPSARKGRWFLSEGRKPRFPENANLKRKIEPQMNADNQRVASIDSFTLRVKLSSEVS
jgi:hypothetical protein